jgi:hypothetical protein
MKKLVLVSLAVFAFTSCAHHRDVRPGSDGVNHVVVRSPTREDAERSAISQANHYCEQFDKHAGFIEENKTQYTGSMDENTRDTVRKASTAAQILGGTGVAVGKRGTQTAGGVLGTAGVIGGVMTNGDDYLADMRFKCQ